MEHVFTQSTVCSVIGLWAVANKTNRMALSYRAGRSDRQQHYRESDQNNGQL